MWCQADANPHTGVTAFKSLESVFSFVKPIPSLIDSELLPHSLFHFFFLYFFYFSYFGYFMRYRVGVVLKASPAKEIPAAEKMKPKKKNNFV